MATEVVMPQMGESIFEGTITRWLKQPGDMVQKDEVLLEISTDKVDAEIPSPAAGVLSEIKFPEGSTVEVNTVIAIIGGEMTQAATVAATQKPLNGAQAAQEKPAAAEEHVARDGERMRSSPLVRRIAKENKLNLHAIPGTGLGGRINKQDVLDFLARGAVAAQAKPTGQAATPQPVSKSGLRDELVPMTKMREIIAQRMVASVQSSPHAHTVYKIDMTRIVHLRERERAAFEKRNGVKLTYMPFIAAATVEALKQFPILNGSLEGMSIRYHKHIHLGIAVALEWGLIVPVIRNAEQRTFVELASAIADLAQRARTKKLLPDETGGSTFTLTNSGAYGGEFGTPILNQPEAAILAIGGLRKEPAVLTDAEGNDSIAIRSLQYYCLGFDHRVIDGADSGKFMLELKRVLESWDRPLA